MSTYKIVRFFRDEGPEDRQRGLSLDEAQAHCRRDDTHGDGWFDGYTEDDSDSSRAKRNPNPDLLLADVWGQYDNPRLDEHVGDNPQPLPVLGGKRNVKRRNAKSGDPRTDRTANEKSQS